MLETSIKSYLRFSHRHTLQYFTITQQYASSNKYDFHKNVDMDCKTPKNAFKMCCETTSSPLVSILVQQNYSFFSPVLLHVSPYICSK